jgi:hypothetical protein
MDRPLQIALELVFAHRQELYLSHPRRGPSFLTISSLTNVAFKTELTCSN